MDDYQLRVTYKDFYGVWKSIQSSLIREGPLSINLQLNIESDDLNCPFFSPEFVKSESPDALCHLFVIGYDSKFDKNQTTEINIWRSKNPGTAFLVLILVIAKSQWSFTSQRSRIESQFLSAVPTSRIVIAKYIIDDKLIPESDLKMIHTSLANLIQISNQDRISTLQQQMEKLKIGSKEYIQTASELAALYHTFGFLSASKDLYLNLIQSQMDLPFWTNAPMNYDIRRLGSKIAFESGFDVVASSIHGIVRSLLQKNDILQLSDYISLCFSVALQNAESPEQKIFCRQWIHYTAVNICDMIENGSSAEGKEKILNSFSMIALSQMLHLLDYDKLGYDFKSPFLQNVSKENESLFDESLKNQLFLSEMTRAKNASIESPQHLAYISSVFFDFFFKKGDIKGALASIANTSLDPSVNKQFRKSYIDSHVLEQLFTLDDYHTEEIATILLSSKASDKGKLDALKFLSTLEVEVNPQFSIFPCFHSPYFFEKHNLLEQVSFKLSYKLPNWMCGLEVMQWVQLSSLNLSDDYSILSEMKKITLDSKMQFESSITCNCVGVFDVMYLVFQYGSVFLVWDIPIPHALEVIEKNVPPSFDLLMPCMIAKGYLQSGIFTVENLDVSALEITFYFEMDGLEEIMYTNHNGEIQHFQPNSNITIKKFESAVKLILLYRIKDENIVGVNFSILERDGNISTITQQFTVPISGAFNIRLFKQTTKFQQFQIVNVFQQTFSFDFEGKHHIIPPHTLYSILREASDAPLVLKFYEEGWEEYPVEISASNFLLDRMTVKLGFDNKKWTVGDPRLVTVDPPAIAMMEDEKNWVVAQQDPEGRKHLLIPKHPGKLQFPKFQINQQVAEPIPKDIEIAFNVYPPIIPF